MDGKPRRAHRVAYELLVGPIPEGLVLDHLCRVRHCVNPDHLEPVTKRENERRGKCGELFVRVRTCLRGHELSASNVYMWGNPPRRYCRKCYLTRKKRK